MHTCYVCHRARTEAFPFYVMVECGSRKATRVVCLARAIAELETQRGREVDFWNTGGGTNLRYYRRLVNSIDSESSAGVSLFPSSASARFSLASGDFEIWLTA